MGKKRRETHGAFTLIELLIVVAIIAILAAIAVPNFLEAQVRSKVARVKSDLRSIKTGLESYCVDYNTYPNDSGWQNLDYRNTWVFLTTPIAYLTSVFESPFAEELANPDAGLIATARRNYEYWGQHFLRNPPLKTTRYIATSVGPNNQDDMVFFRVGNWIFPYEEAMDPEFVNRLYDPTNGTKSYGALLTSNIRMY